MCEWLTLAGSCVYLVQVWWWWYTHVITKKKMNLCWHISITLFICPVIQQGARGYHSSTSTNLITTSTTNVLVCNFHSILRSTMLTETSDSINPAYELTWTPQLCMLYTFILKGHNALLYLCDYELNQRLNLDWQSCYKCCDSLVFIHQVHIIKCQKPSHVFFFIQDKGDGI